MPQPKIKIDALDTAPGNNKVMTTDGTGLLSLPANGLVVGTNQLITGGSPGAYYVRTHFDINIYGALQLGSAQQNAIYKGGTDFFIARNYTQDYTIWQVWAPPQADVLVGDREATLALVREDTSGNAEFIDVYNNGYNTGGEVQHGIRVQKRGTGLYRPFVFDWYDGTNPKIESFRVTETEISVSASTLKFGDAQTVPVNLIGGNGSANGLVIQGKDIAAAVGTPVTVRAGAGGTTNAGGALILVGGEGGATSGAGGDVEITGGTSTNGAAGNVVILGGSGDTANGTVTIEGGESTTADGGNVILKGGLSVTATFNGGEAQVAGGGGDAGGAAIIRGGDGTAGAGGDVTVIGGTGTTTAGNAKVGTPSLATTATAGFIYVPTCAGTPTGTPVAVTGMAPIVVDSTNNKLYFYSGGAWRDAGP